MSFDDEKKHLDLSSQLSPQPQEYHEGEDLAKKILATAGSQAPITPEEERALVRKIDFWLMPVMFVVFGLQYADKSALVYFPCRTRIKSPFRTFSPTLC